MILERVNFYALVVSVLLLCGCEQAKVDEIKFENGVLSQITYEKDRIKSISILNEDSVKHGESKSFDENGKLVSISYYVQGLKDSVETKYYSSGDVKMITLWNEGKRYRSERAYYDNLKDVYFTLKGSDTVKVTEKLRKAYRYYDLAGNLVYERRFNKKGDLISEKGNLIALKGYSGLKFERGDTLKLQYYVVDPDWVNHKFVVNFFDNVDTLIRSDSLEINEDHTAFFHVIVLPEEGLFKVEAICTMSDELFDNHKTDISTLDIQVGSLSRI